MDKIKSADSCCLPPCKPVLVQKLKRTNYVANIWRNANLAEPAPRPPNGYGWDIAEGKNCLKFVWFEGPQSPNNIDLGPLSDENQADSDEDDELIVHPLMKRKTVMINEDICLSCQKLHQTMTF